MPQGVLAFAASNTAGGTNIDTAAISDPQMPRQNSHFLPPVDLYLTEIAVFGDAISDARLVSPSLRLPFLPYLYPLNTVANSAGFGTDPNIADYRLNPFRARMLEELELDTSNTKGTASECGAIVFFSTGPLDPPVQGQIFTLKCTASITCVAYTWTSGTLTLGQTLPQGEYTVVGMFCQSATGLAARLIFPGDPMIGQWRPGCVAVAAIGNRGPFAGRKNPRGTWGKFKNTALPQLEMFCASTDSSQVVFLDLVKTA